MTMKSRKWTRSLSPTSQAPSKDQSKDGGYGKETSSHTRKSVAMCRHADI